jgi:branched-chain amino acid transport system substrate-binding protein
MAMNTKRVFLPAVSLTAVLATIGGCAPPGASPDDSGDSTEALKVGLLSPLTGPLAGPGEDMRDGFLLYLQEQDNQLGGREVDLIIEDSEGQPEAGIQKTRRMVTRNGVELVVGPLLGNVGLAVGDYMGTTGKPLFYPIPASEAFLRDKPENLFMAGGTAAQDAHPLGEFVAKEGHEKVLTICSDYSFGHELCGGFVNSFTDNGGKIVKQLWPPLGTADFGPFMSQMTSGQFDAVYSGVVGADSVKFLSSYGNFGLDETAPLFTSLQPMDQSLVPAMGKDALGVVSSGHWAEGRDEAITREFVDAYEEEFGKVPGYYSGSGYLAGQWVDKALTDTGGEVGSAEDFLGAVAQVDLGETIFGPVELDDNGNIVWPEYIRRVEEREDGTLWNVVEKELDPAGPTWNYDFETYLEQPTYTRDYQGADWPKDCSAFAADCPLN